MSKQDLAYSALADLESALDTHAGLSNTHPRLKLKRRLVSFKMEKDVGRFTCRPRLYGGNHDTSGLDAPLVVLDRQRHFRVLECGGQTEGQKEQKELRPRQNKAEKAGPRYVFARTTFNWCLLVVQGYYRAYKLGASWYI